ncbi:hypothetical protein HT031_004770 [Scenedesmus sp. PABB004]|nr:hypothetical protein HT031_004770 [Scenedesmus sp. PABB004]
MASPPRAAAGQQGAEQGSAGRLRSPGAGGVGRAGASLNFGRGEQVVTTPVRAARLELQDYSSTFMGVRGPQWLGSSFVPDTKYGRAASDERLANQLLAASLVPSDLRATRTAAGAAFDALHRDHAFTRGDATTGWNHSTELTRAERRRAQAALDGAAAAATARRVARVRRYVSPQQREAACAGGRRAAKEAAAAQGAELAARYGPDGAAAMLAMPARSWPPAALKATRDDLAAVRCLPPLGLAEP